MMGSSLSVTRFLVRGVISSVPSKLLPLSLSLMRIGGRRGLGWCCPPSCPYDDGDSEDGLTRIVVMGRRGRREEEEEKARRGLGGSLQARPCSGGALVLVMK